eukprot:g946.t1
MSETNQIVELAENKRQTKRGHSRVKYDLFYHPLCFPHNTWVWRFIPGVLVGLFGSLLLFSNRLRNGSSRRKDPNHDGLSHGQSSNSTSTEAPVDVKLMLVINGELKSMRPGKMGAQCGHAAAMTMKKLILRHKRLLSQWEQCGQKKICVEGLSRAHLESLSEQASRAGLLVNPVFDAGKTQVEQGSLTVVAIGPAESEILHPITGQLNLMS